MYNVAFQYTRECGGYAGVITWTSFKSKEEFDKWYTPEIKERQKVMEEGITPERAIELVKKTSIDSRIGACIEDATDKRGRIDSGRLAMELVNLSFLKRMERREEENQ